MICRCGGQVIPVRDETGEIIDAYCEECGRSVG